jgi:outer membrane protein assembly factor BamB
LKSGRSAFGSTFVIWTALAVGCGGSAADEFAVMHRGNARRTGVFAGPAPAEPTEALWRIDANLGSGALVVAGSRLYFVSAKKSLHAVDTSTGVTAWTCGRESEQRELLATRGGAAVVANDTVYWADGEALHALAAETGRVRWKLASSVFGTPTFANGTVYVAGSALQAVNAATGQERWRFALDDGGKGSFVSAGPVVDQGLVFIGQATRAGATLFAIDADTGRQRWTLRGSPDLPNEPEGFVTAIAVDEGTVYFGLSFGMTDAGGASFRAADAATGREKWRRSGLHSSLFVSPAPVIAGAMAYWVAMEASAGAEGPASLYALDARTGEERWRRQLDLTGDDRFQTELIFVDGLLYMGMSRALVAMDARTGEEKWRFKTDEQVFAGPTVSNGVLYFGGRDVLRAVR